MDARKQRSAEVKQRLRDQGFPTLAAFAAEHGYKYRDVSEVVRGIRVGLYGKGREIAKRLGIPVED